MAIDVLEIGVLVVLWGLTVRRFTTPQTPRGRVVRLLILLVTVAITLNRWEISYAFDRAVHVPDGSVLVKNLAGEGAAATIVRLIGLVSATPGHGVRLRRFTYGLLGAASAGMAVIFWVVPRSPTQGDFVQEHPTSLLVATYGVLTQAGLGIGMIAAFLLFRAGLGGGRGPARFGARLLVAGSVVGVVYVFYRLTFVLANPFGFTFVGGPGYIAGSRILLGTTMLLFAVGGAVPALDNLRRRVTHYRALHRLRPLWQEVSTAVPQVVLGDPPSRFEELLPWGTLELRLYRRIIEIRDAQWLLCGALDDVVTERGRQAAAGTGLTGSQLDYATEAAVLRAGVRAGQPTGAPAAGSPESPVAGGPDIDSEIRALLAVSYHYWTQRQLMELTAP